MVQCYFVVLGDYSVVESQDGNKMIAGTIPSELGKLRNWKYVVFSKFTEISSNSLALYRLYF